MSGHVGNLSAKQQQSLEKFRERARTVVTEKHINDDYYLLRWLRARDFDVHRAEKMLVNSMAWRCSVKADTILTTWRAPEVIQKYYTGGLFGHDKQGCPVWIDPFGYIDLKGISRSTTKNEIIRNKILLLEMIYKIFDEKSKEGRIEQIVLIFDLEHFGMKHLWKPGMDIFCDILTIFEEHYPETMKKTYIINAPKIFPIAFHLIKPFMSEATVNKIIILGRHWKDHLLQHIDADQLPVHWGGTCTDENGDIKCSSKICQGGMVPSTYYRGSLKADVISSEKMCVQTVGRGSSVQIEYSIKEQGCVLRWQFETDHFDIGFGVFLKTQEGHQHASRMKSLVESQRVNSHLVPEDGTLNCDILGTYVVRFDNTFSWTRSKRVSYIIEILAPENLSTDSSGLTD